MPARSDGGNHDGVFWSRMRTSPPPPPPYRFERIMNFRELGGLTTATGARIPAGMVYRSGSLGAASERDVAVLQSLGIKTICDLRSERERRAGPDRFPRAARYVPIPVTPRNSQYIRPIAQLYALITGKLSNTDFDKVLRELYRDLVERFTGEFARVMRLVAEPHCLPILIHCTGGKDRTGFACAVLSRLLDIPDERVFDDYLLSTEYLRQFRTRIQRQTRLLRLFGFNAEQLAPFATARREYLQESFDCIDRHYGSFNSYVARGLGLDQGFRRALRSLLLIGDTSAVRP
jgi:protein-tyrosine phosphatase